ncbi:DUF3304 domain-containing protein [Achromobacter sp.]|uniref:DUF3304 domain-containing protein n=1 Tax=Achromobacter sp. TaxID=134375 RepID=UPI00289FC667|nr:DUF3304 domain-containing protein [Achromobacter sp.]
MKTLLINCTAALCLLLAGCDAGQARQDTIPAPLTGIDHLADHLSIQDFWVNGTSGHQAGGGGRVVCCVKLPQQWHSGLTVVVGWGVTNWRDCTWESHERRVPVERYTEVGSLYVHFLSDGRVRVVSSNISPGYSNKDYAGPHDPIPRKTPYEKYGTWSPRCPVGAKPVLTESLDE